MERPETKSIVKTGRHPIHQAADLLKRTLTGLGFELVDNGDGLEVESIDTSFPTCTEPEDLLAWQDDPLVMGGGETVLRTRLLPSHLCRKGTQAPARVLAFGHVYRKAAPVPKCHQIEGLVVEKGMTLETWESFWQDVAVSLFGSESQSSLVRDGMNGYTVIMKDTVLGKTYILGYTGPAGAQTLKHCEAGEEYAGWVFIIDVDAFTVQHFDIEQQTDLYDHRIEFLSRFDNDTPAFGASPLTKAVDVLRGMGYRETCGDVLYPADAYKKMTMIQESWDKNNQAYLLAEPFGEFTGTRTVLTPSIEKIMGYNYERGVKTLNIFEAGHIYMPKKDSVLPKEHFAVALGAYGPDVNIETFRKDIIEFMQGMGVSFSRFIPTNFALAYKWNECLVIVGKNGYMDSNFGRISVQAAKNHGMDIPAYFAQFELAALVAAAD